MPANAFGKASTRYIYQLPPSHSVRFIHFIFSGGWGYCHTQLPYISAYLSAMYLCIKIGGKSAHHTFSISHALCTSLSLSLWLTPLILSLDLLSLSPVILWYVAHIESISRHSKWSPIHILYHCSVHQIKYESVDHRTQAHKLREWERARETLKNNRMDDYIVQMHCLWCEWRICV